VGRSERLSAARSFDASRFIPFVADGRVLGHVRRDHAERLRRFGDILTIGESEMGFCPALDAHSTRSDAMARIARDLAAEGRLSAWRAETYDIVAEDGGASAFVLERCAVRFFGFTARAVHVNGLTRANGRPAMWIARRSARKAIDPGLLDNMVGGGLASGLSIEATLVKEAWEEAGIGQGLARSARAANTLRVLREVPDGLHAEIIHVYDLDLPEHFEPVNQDGEVAEFRRLALDEVARELEGDAAYTVDAALVAIECLERHGMLLR
jgi:8-oxo-dGTP pyrophosphatase MutT (NUDIX family)